MLQANLLAPAQTVNEPPLPTIQDEWARASTDAERAELLNELLGEVDFDRAIDDIE